MTVPQIGEHDGLSYALFLPDEPAEAGVLILHGAGSAKESHFDFGRLAVGHGMAALAYDARGHGRSNGEFGARAIDDVVTMLGVLREHARHVAIRGSSMGGFQAILGAARDGDVGAVVAICPAPPGLLRQGGRSRRPPNLPVDRPGPLRLVPP